MVMWFFFAEIKKSSSHCVRNNFSTGEFLVEFSVEPDKVWPIDFNLITIAFLTAL